MSTHRFFVTSDQIQNGRVVFFDSQAHQINSVLRLRKGERILVLDNSGWQYEAQLSKVESSIVIGNILSKQLAPAEPPVKITLFQSLLKRDNFEWVLQKGTELGIAFFVPLITQRTIVRQKSLRENKLARWRRVISEAAEQSGRGQIPKLCQPLSFEEALSTTNDKLAIISWENEKDLNIASAFAAASAKSGVALFIGPEGGFAEDEISAARAAGIIPITLGPRTLRAETAAIVAAALVLHELGEL